MLKEGDKIEINDPSKGTYEALYLSSTHEGRLIQFTIPNSGMGGLVGKCWVTKKDNDV
ncbi:hypothetical protein KDN24_06805 [Bacillus sp. Bva_UNVM-123]|uniref:hypothetical protein n=1 Tax=Bacillus sp. Bva_UNVM-123 TaxID=2829798 RepID=UPI00391EF7D4